MNYLKWAEQTITDFSDSNISSLYNEGYLLTREHRGSMYQTRSLRVDLSKFELTSENRRVLKKIEDLRFKIEDLPLKNYDWKIGKMAKDFYETKFGKGIFSANKVKELLTIEHNFNKLLTYTIAECRMQNAECTNGYCICYENKDVLHYSYPFYNLKSEICNLGMSMMLNAIIWAKENNKKYVYLGSAKDEKAKYKLQFEGLEWFDGGEWRDDLDKLKSILK